MTDGSLASDPNVSGPGSRRIGAETDPTTGSSSTRAASLTETVTGASSYRAVEPVVRRSGIASIHRLGASQSSARWTGASTPRIPDSRANWPAPLHHIPNTCTISTPVHGQWTTCPATVDDQWTTAPRTWTATARAWKLRPRAWTAQTTTSSVAWRLRTTTSCVFGVDSAYPARYRSWVA